MYYRELGQLLLVMVIGGLISYVPECLGLYTIAKRRGSTRPWLAWIPAVNQWVLGGISDQYRFAVKGQRRGRRKTLLGWSVAAAGCWLAVAVMFVCWLIQWGNVTFPGTDDGAWLTLWGMLLCMLLLLLPGAVAALVQTVLRHMALYDLYASANSTNKMLCLILGILFPILQGFFVLNCRNSDRGMENGSFGAMRTEENVL